MKKPALICSSPTNYQFSMFNNFALQLPEPVWNNNTPETMWLQRNADNSAAFHPLPLPRQLFKSALFAKSTMLRTSACLV